SAVASLVNYRTAPRAGNDRPHPTHGWAHCGFRPVTVEEERMRNSNLTVRSRTCAAARTLKRRLFAAEIGRDMVRVGDRLEISGSCNDFGRPSASQRRGAALLRG